MSAPRIVREHPITVHMFSYRSNASSAATWRKNPKHFQIFKEREPPPAAAFAPRAQACGMLAAVKLLQPSSYRAQPWKNGGGVTHEILRWPSREPHDLQDPYDLRISLAEDHVAGPFSLFPGYRRWSYLAAKAPILLWVDGVPRLLRDPGDTLEVDGEVAISCELPAGPTHLLNFLIRRDLPLRPGIGPTSEPVRFVFALTDLPWLPHHCSALFDPARIVELTAHAVWLP